MAEFLDAAIEVARDHPRAYFFMLVGECLASDHADSVEAELGRAGAAFGARLLLTGQRSDIPGHGSLLPAVVPRRHAAYDYRGHDDGEACYRHQHLRRARGGRAGRNRTARGTRDARALARAIARCVADPEWVRILGEAGRKLTLMLYDERNVVAL